ncbi:MAG: HNH endonuclease signature motif containing protein [bacterium]
MERNQRNQETGRNYPKQEFNGRWYYLYTGERYYSKGRNYLHREVWKHYNGEIPEGYHIHHVDGNPANNKIENLQLIEGSEHMSQHSKKWHEENKEQSNAHLESIRHLTKEWHKSEESKRVKSERSKTWWATNPDFGETICDCCEKLFKKNRAGKERFCSNKCKSKYRRDNGLDDVQRKCEHCGELFTVNKYTKTRYCSKACSVRRSNK